MEHRSFHIGPRTQSFESYEQCSSVEYCGFCSTIWQPARDLPIDMFYTLISYVCHTFVTLRALKIAFRAEASGEALGAF